MQQQLSHKEQAIRAHEESLQILDDDLKIARAELGALQLSASEDKATRLSLQAAHGVNTSLYRMSSAHRRIPTLRSGHNHIAQHVLNSTAGKPDVRHMQMI